MRRMYRSLPLRLLLVFALLSAQLGGLMHGIAHTLAEQSQDQSLPHDKHCELCASYAQIGSALNSNDVRFDFAASLTEAPGTHCVSYLPPIFLAFTARAPPYSV